MAKRREATALSSQLPPFVHRQWEKGPTQHGFLWNSDLNMGGDQRTGKAIWWFFFKAAVLYVPCCVTAAFYGQRDKTREMFERIVFICKVTRLQPLPVRKQKMLGENLSPGACYTDYSRNDLVWSRSDRSTHRDSVFAQKAQNTFIQGSTLCFYREH